MINYSGIGTLTLSIDDAAFGTPPASPITVNRSLTAVETYVFKCERAGETKTARVLIPMLSMLPAGTVSIDSNGVWNATINGPNNVQSFKWLASTSSFPTSSAVITGPSNVASGSPWFSITSGGTLSFGQTVFITAVPYTGTGGTGTSLTPIRIQGSYTTFSATKTLNYSAAGTVARFNDPATQGPFPSSLILRDG